MKEAYLNAEMDVVWFAELDIIRCSDTVPSSPEPESTTTFVPANNEGPPAYDAWD